LFRPCAKLAATAFVPGLIPKFTANEKSR
jgi:hypothetical protein